MNIQRATILDVAERAAAEMRENYWGHIYPVDPHVIAEALGIQIHKLALPPNVAGGIWSKKGYPPVIFINESDHENRQRFTCAHELGHYYLREGDDEFEFTDFRNNISSEGTNDVEIFANNFAASLLMPKEEVKRLREEQKTVLMLAKHFGVSLESLGYRLENLGLDRKSPA